jgi:hypothetical protein
MFKAIMYNIHTRDEAMATIKEIETVNGAMIYTVIWFGAVEKISSYQGWTIKEELNG